VTGRRTRRGTGCYKLTLKLTAIPILHDAGAARDKDDDYRHFIESSCAQVFVTGDGQLAGTNGTPHMNRRSGLSYRSNTLRGCALKRGRLRALAGEQIDLARSRSRSWTLSMVIVHCRAATERCRNRALTRDRSLDIGRRRAALLNGTSEVIQSCHAV
jgi:hypothetical protein